MNDVGGLVSIIMASYNAERTINIAIESVLSQTYANWELIVINDCSSDSTAELVSIYNDARIRLISNSSNIGVSCSRKKGLDLATGEWIAILDSDDIWLPDKLEKQILLAKKYSAHLIYTASSFCDVNGYIKDWQLHVPSIISYKSLLKQNLISNSSVLVNSELYRMHFAIGDNMHEDFAVWLNITKTGIIAYGIDEPLLIYRISNSSKSSNKYKSAIMNWNTYRYIGLGFFPSVYYMFFYVINGLLKYHRIESSK